jgi:hypothetical protein
MGHPPCRHQEHDPMTRTLALAAAALIVLSPVARAGDRAAPGARINGLKVLSDRVDDVTTEDNILKSFVKPGMTDAERAQAIWTALIKYRHQAPPPNEYLAADWEAHDPVKILNVYGYCMCCCSSALVEALNRADGREARGRILNNHSVPEVRYGDAWHMFDASLITVFPKTGGEAASVDEIAGAVASWYADHPGSKGNKAKLAEIMRGDGWTGWKTQGPALLAACPYYRQGFFPAGTHGWADTMAEYAREPREVYEYGYHVGHRALFRLRPGEAIVREAGNRGLHVNMDRMPNWDGLKARAPEKDLAYLDDFLLGYRGGLVGNGVHRYAPNLTAGDLAAGAEVYENLTEGGDSPRLRPKGPDRPGVAVVEVASPYVYLGGRLRLKATQRTAADRVAVSISTNNGRGFAPLWSAETTGTREAVIDLSPMILRRYAFWLKVELASDAPGGAGLDVLDVESDIQHAPRTLPGLGRGRTAITVAADGDPAVATRFVACRITPDAAFGKNETTGTMGVTFDNLDVKDGACWWKDGEGSMTVPVEVPGDLVALRVCAQARARGERDAVTIRASIDGGQTWREVGRIAGPTPGTTRSFRVADWPSGTRSALLRFEMSGSNTIGVMSFRADADYRDPLARVARPFRVVHRWKQGGGEKEHVQVIASLPSRYEIVVDDEPEMLSVSYEMPTTR